MFMVRIQEASKRAGLETIVVQSKANALSKAAEHPVLIVLDLNYTPGEPLDLIAALKADQATRDIHLLAFVSHVQTETRAAAVAAGCDTVLPRSAFAQRLPEIIQQCLNTAQPT